MLIPNGLSTVGSHQAYRSSLPSQALRAQRPLNQVKHRSFVPTVFSLLVNTADHEKPVQTFNGEIADGQLMEAQLKNREIPEYKEKETDKASKSEFYNNDECANVLGSPVTSNRTEDIFIREDENGIRSHFCPLNPLLDGRKEDDEKYPDNSTNFDFDYTFMLNGCNLDSEEIPFLMAEKPSTSDSEDNTGSSETIVSTPLEYASTENVRSASDNAATIRFLSEQVEQIDRDEKLDQKTMTSWADSEEYSDDTEYYATEAKDSELLLKKRTVGNESDMEEFKETRECEKEHQDLESSQHDEKRSMIGKNLQIDNKYSTDRNYDSSVEKGKPESSLTKYDDDNNNEKYQDNCSEYKNGVSHCEKADANKLDEDISTNNCEPDNSKSLNDKQDTESKRNSIYHSENTSTNKLDEDRSTNKYETDNSKPLNYKQDTLSKIEITAIVNEKARQTNLEDETLRNAMLDTVSKLLYLDDGSKLVLGADSTKKSAEIVTKNEDATTTEESNASKTEMQQVITDPEKNGKSDASDVNPSNQAKNLEEKPRINSSMSSLPAPEGLRDKEKKALGMEPTLLQIPLRDEETHPDLATALRFMTEVYHSKDDELYSDTLSTTDMPIERPAKEKSLAPDALNEDTSSQRVNSEDRPLSTKSLTQSSPFEPTEEQRVATTRPRNKFSKFFKSFKQKLIKKA